MRAEKEWRTSHIQEPAFSAPNDTRLHFYAPTWTAPHRCARSVLSQVADLLEKGVFNLVGCRPVRGFPPDVCGLRRAEVGAFE